MEPHRTTRGRAALGSLLLGAALLPAACERAGDTPAPSPGPDAPAPALAETERDQLALLGYIDVTEEAVDPSRVGVVVLDRERAQPGYNLYCSHNAGHGELIDLEGGVMNVWRDPGSRYWANCRLLPDGDLLVVGVELDPARPKRKVDSQRFLMRLSWSGEVRWKRSIPVHHHASLTPDGRIIALSLRYETRPDLRVTADVRVDLATLLTPDGEVVEERSLLDAFTSDPGQLRLHRYPVRRRWGRMHIDLIHANTVEWFDRSPLAGRDPIYAPDNVLVTSRHQNVVAIIEWETNRLLWAWGQGEIIGPHDATLLESGNILLLDNGGDHRAFSRALEIDPLRKEIVWEWRAPEPSDFYTATRGSVQRLANGNTLITNSNHGQAFEVTREGEIVWEFLNPNLTEDRRRPIMRRVERYPEASVEAILAAQGRP